jgi:hypothetical protein
MEDIRTADVLPIPPFARVLEFEPQQGADFSFACENDIPDNNSNEIDSFQALLSEFRDVDEDTFTINEWADAENTIPYGERNVAEIIRNCPLSPRFPALQHSASFREKDVPPQINQDVTAWPSEGKENGEMIEDKIIGDEQDDEPEADDEVEDEPAKKVKLDMAEHIPYLFQGS